MSSDHHSAAEDERAIDALVDTFYGLFSNRGGRCPELRRIFDLCVEQAIISRCVTTPAEVSSLEAFIAPRQRLLSDGTLTEFEEVENEWRTLVLGNIGQRVSFYTKSGWRNGEAFRTRGVKLFQFVRTPAGWRISAVAWDDEREGFRPDPLVRQEPV